MPSFLQCPTGHTAQRYVFFFSIFFLSFWPHHAACGILVPQPEMEPAPPAVEAQSLNLQTTREVLPALFNMAGATQGCEYQEVGLIRLCWGLGPRDRTTAEPVLEHLLPDFLLCDIRSPIVIVLLTAQSILIALPQKSFFFFCLKQPELDSVTYKLKSFTDPRE